MTGAEILIAIGCDVVVLCLVALAAITLLRHHPTKRYVVCLAALVSVWAIPAIVVVQSLTGFGVVRIPLPFLHLENLPTNGVVGSLHAPVIGRIAGDGSHASTNVFWIGFCVWSLGVLIGLIRLAIGYGTMKRIVRNATPWDSPAATNKQSWVGHATSAAKFPILVSNDISVPAATGVFRPVILLPAETEAALPPDQLNQILIHEASHLTLNHLHVAFVARLTGIAFWPNPLIHLLRKQILRAQEEICDNVASQVAGATCYARTLLEFAQGLSPAPLNTSALALLGPEISVESRIVGLLNPRRNKMFRIKNWQLAAVASVAVVSMASIRLVIAESRPHGASVEAKLPLRTSKSHIKYDVVLTNRLAKPSADRVVARGPLRVVRDTVRNQVIRSLPHSKSARTAGKNLAVITSDRVRVQLAQ
jgi:beta-lactamase regulating signal transducer with metallopeptidase domain